ncbi:hypothetical protein HispidOSU_019217 [Sigmodon hispidus]
MITPHRTFSPISQMRWMPLAAALDHVEMHPFTLGSKSSTLIPYLIPNSTSSSQMNERRIRQNGEGSLPEVQYRIQFRKNRASPRVKDFFRSLFCPGCFGEQL